MDKRINIPSFLEATVESQNTSPKPMSCDFCEYDCETSCERNPSSQTVCTSYCEDVCQETCQLSCQNCNNCEVTCQYECQDPCQLACQACESACEAGTTCQAPCQLSCQSCNTCEQPCQISSQHSHNYTSRYDYATLNATQHTKKSYCSCGDYSSSNENHTFDLANYYYQSGYIKCKCSYCTEVKNIESSPLFAWDEPKTQDVQIRITAHEMNKFIVLLNQKLNGLNDNTRIATVQVGANITAETINKIRLGLTLIKATNVPPAVTQTTNLSTPGTTIAAQFLNQLVTSINSIR